MICSMKNDDNKLSSIRLLIILFTRCLLAQPVSRTQASDYSKVMNFLTTYGYISNDDLRSSSLKSADYLSKAIGQMQKYGGLNVTGNLDDQTLALMSKRRCGNPDADHIYEYDDSTTAIRDSNEQNKSNERRIRLKRYALNGEKWPSNKVTWNIKSWPQQMNRNQVTRILQSSFDLWSGVSKLDFQQVTTNQEAEIEIQFVRGEHGDNFPFDGSGKVLAHAFYPGTGIGGDVHFDLDEVWMEEETEDDEMNSRKVNQLFAVASHEIGHALGLSHSSVYGSLMFPYYQKINSRQYKLSQDDVQGIQLLYGSKEQTRWTPVNLPVTSTTPSPNRLPPSNYPSTNQTNPYPDICITDFDAIANIRGEIFFFKNKYFWRLADSGKLERNYPVEIKQFFKFPGNIERVDAVYERPLSKKIIFFIDNLYYEFTGNRVASGFPKSIQNLGFSADVKKIDAAIVWSYNGKTYFFSDGEYWRFDEEEEKTEPDYPRSMSVWKGIPYDVDTAFTLQADGLTYFTKKNEFYKFKNSRMKTIEGPSFIAKQWFSHYCR